MISAKESQTHMKTPKSSRTSANTVQRLMMGDLDLGDRFTKLPLVCFITLVLLCFLAVEYTEVHIHGTASTWLAWLHDGPNLMKLGSLLVIALTCLHGWRAVRTRGLLMAYGAHDGESDIHCIAFIASSVIFITVRCVAQRDLPVPVVYHGLAPFIAIRWPTCRTTLQNLARHFFSMAYMWSLLFLFPNDAILTGQTTMADVALAVLPINAVMLAVFVINRFVNMSRNEMLHDLKQRNDVLESLLPQMPCLVWAMDLHLEPQWVRGSLDNGTAAPLALSGYDFTTEMKEEITVKHRRVVEEGVDEHYMFEGKNRDVWGDKKVNFSVRLKPLRREKNGPIVGAIGVGYDVTEAMEMEKLLKRSRHDYAQLVSCISDTIISLDQELYIKFINRDSFLGKPREQLLGQSFPELFDSCKDEMETTLHDALEQDAKETTICWWFDQTTHECFTKRQVDEKLLKHRIIDGTVQMFMGKVNLSNFKAESSFSRESETAIHLILSVRDMTESCRAAEQQKKAEETAAFNKGKGKFIRQLSHEIRNPLTCICGSLELFEHSASNLTPLQKEYISHSRAASQFLLEISNNVLDAEQISTGQLNLRIADHSILDTIETISTMQAANATRHNLDVVSFIDPRIPPILQFDRTRVSQILSNLISNSIKFTNSGYIYLSAHLLEENSSGVVVELRCEDTGAGIREEDLTIMFLPFTQLHRERRPTDFRGFGLGLGIVKSLLETMGGSIDVKSTVEVGSVFSLRIPFKKSTKRGTGPSYEHISQTLVPSWFETVVVISPCPPLQIALQQYLSTAKVSNILSLDNATEMTAQQVVDHVKQITNYRRQDDAKRIATIFDLPTDRALESANLLHVLGYTNIMYLNGDSAMANSSHYEPHSILMKPLSLMKLTRILSRTVERTPMTSRQLEAVNLPNDVETPGKRPTTVMVVDDNNVVAKVHMKYLSQLGYHHVIRAVNGKEAVDAVLKSDPGEIVCILMDIQMPVLDGLQATKLIRAIDDPVKCRIPIIAVTANGDEETVAKCLAHGLNGHLQKPYTQLKLFAALGRVMNISKSQDETMALKPVSK